MTLKSEAKFKENLPCDFKYDVRNLINFHQITQKYEDFFLMGSFYPNYTRFAQQKNRRVTFYETELYNVSKLYNVSATKLQRNYVS